MTENQSDSSQGSSSRRTASSWQSRVPLIRFDGIFLIVLGAFGLCSDLASYLGAVGPFGATFLRNPGVIGVIEAHGLAVLTGIAACAVGANAARYWHVHLAITHALLGGANVVFFDVFRQIGAQAGGIAVTVVHFLLVILQIRAAGRIA